MVRELEFARVDRFRCRSLNFARPLRLFVRQNWFAQSADLLCCLMVLPEEFALRVGQPESAFGLVLVRWLLAALAVLARVDLHRLGVARVESGQNQALDCSQQMDWPRSAVEPELIGRTSQSQ